MDELNALIEQVTIPAFNEVDKNLLATVYQQVFSIELNHKCPNCLNDAYWLLKVELKKRTKTLSTGNGLTKHKILKDFLIQSPKHGSLTPANITDAQCAELLKNPAHLEYFVPLKGTK